MIWCGDGDAIAMYCGATAKACRFSYRIKFISVQTSVTDTPVLSNFQTLLLRSSFSPSSFIHFSATTFLQVIHCYTHVETIIDPYAYNSTMPSCFFATSKTKPQSSPPMVSDTAVPISPIFPHELHPTRACFPGPGCGPSKCASSTAPIPPFTASIAFGSKPSSSSLVPACPAHKLPPAAALAMPA